ncbi:MAG: GNAT family N-acetyltransferase [Nocardioidaceae bacterium]
MTSESATLQRLESYYDAVPRRRSRTEELGPFTLFVARVGWPYYARPVLGGEQSATTADVRDVLARQRELDVPRSLEWVDEVTPGLVEVAREAGLFVESCPLLVLDGQPRRPAATAMGTARVLEPTELDVVAASRAAVHVSFTQGGTARGEAGIKARDAHVADHPDDVSDNLVSSLRDGWVRLAAAFANEDADLGHSPVAEVSELGPVGGGSHSPVTEVSELAGIAVLPAYRRQGLGAQLTCVLAADALSLGVSTVFCSAQSDEVARIYEGIGFRRVGTACIAAEDAH